MNHLIIFAHPERNSFNGALLDRYAASLGKAGHNVEIRDLYQMNFQPALSWEEYQASFHGSYAEDVKTEHEYIRAADVLTFIYPVWWAGLPALGKGYLDRVFTYGFAYELDGENPIPLLNGKKAAAIFTTGTPAHIYKETGMLESMKQTINEGLFQFCGLEGAGHLYFGNAVLADDKEHEKMLKEAAALAHRF